MSHWEAPGKSDDWYTPRHVFDALGCEFDMDVAGDMATAAYCVPARAAINSGSLARAWSAGAFLWMNPPFGGRNSLEPWLEKFFAHGSGLALTPDRTSAPWFQDAWSRAGLVMFTRKIRFLRATGEEGRAPSCGTALWAVGEKAEKALRRAANTGLGILARPERG